MPTTGSRDARAERVRHHLTYVLGRAPHDASPADLGRALALAIRDDVVDRMLETDARQRAADPKRIYYLSIEFLIGRALGNTLCNLGVYEAWRETAASLGLQLDDVLEAEPDPALGNGGLGRLAACFLDSMATLDLPGFGYGINYEFGLFRQRIEDGAQQERPDQWSNLESPWLLDRHEEAYAVPVYGEVEDGVDANGDYNPLWLGWKVILGVPYDMPIVGYGGRTVNRLRLFSARASDEFDVQIFNNGDYVRAVEQKISSERVSKVLYPPDTDERGKELRLVQEYFLVACALRDVMREYRRSHQTLDGFPDRVAIQLNDTHPALAIAELMRMLVDEDALAWPAAWDLTVRTFGYTNHTLLPEALEKWPVPLLARVLPRHLQIIYEINRRFLERVEAVAPGDDALKARVSIIEESSPKQVRMAHLSIVGAHSINGVAALHTRLIISSLVPDFARLYPERFNSKTNGITPRRWLLKANPELAALATEVVGPGWPADLDRLRGLEAVVDDPAFQERFHAIKRRNKARLAALVQDTSLVTIDPDTLFDVQAKRFHEYKRQLLNLMHVVHLYLAVTEDGRDLIAPRTCVFAGKAAPSYDMAKLIIRLINAVADVVNAEPRCRGQLRVAFVPDYRVSVAERIMPAADLSEQISTAGKEASGTGNMKFALNGALTMATLDGANVELRDEVGEENIYLFGLTVAEVEETVRAGYRPRDYYERDPRVRRVVDAIGSGRFTPADPGRFGPIVDALLHRDPYLHLADLGSYIQAQEIAAREYLDRRTWTRKAGLNTARSGFFSSDRTVKEYARDIWNVKPV